MSDSMIAECGHEESWHHVRVCPSCNTLYHALHCEHDRHQGSAYCGSCGAQSRYVEGGDCGDECELACLECALEERDSLSRGNAVSAFAKSFGADLEQIEDLIVNILDGGVHPIDALIEAELLLSYNAKKAKAGGVRIKRPNKNRSVIVAYFEKRENAAGGRYHIVTDDGNTRDCDVVWCIKQAWDAGDFEAVEVGVLLYQMSRNARGDVYGGVYEHA